MCIYVWLYVYLHVNECTCVYTLSGPILPYIYNIDMRNPFNNGHPCSSLWLSQWHKEEKAMEGLRCKKLDTRLYVSLKEKHRAR